MYIQSIIPCEFPEVSYLVFHVCVPSSEADSFLSSINAYLLNLITVTLSNAKIYKVI